MRAIIKRVRWAQAQSGGQVLGQIAQGLLVCLGAAGGDRPADARKMADRIWTLRVFDDDRGKQNLTVQDVRGGILAVADPALGAAGRGIASQVAEALSPDDAAAAYQAFMAEIRGLGCAVTAGVFGEGTAISSEADGPVNLVIDMSAGSDACSPEPADNET